MKTFGEYIRNRREQLKLPLRKVAPALDVDTSILSKIERGERQATIEMLPILANTLNLSYKDLEIEFIQEFIETELGDLKYLKEGLQEILKEI